MSISEVTFKFIEKLNEVQQYLDKVNANIPYKRAFVAYLGGLIRAPVYNKIRKQALNVGADELTIEALDRFITQDETACRLWRAYCYINYYNKSIEETALRFSVPRDILQAMLDANALGLFFEWVNWPKDL